MDHVKFNQNLFDQLKSRTEEILDHRDRENNVRYDRDNDLERLIDELKTCQLELETQNQELRQTHDSLRDTRQRYQDLYENAPVSYFIFDPAGMIQDVNTNALGLLGYDRTRLVNQMFKQFIAPDFQEKFSLHCRDAGKQGTQCRCELVLKKKDGGTFYAQLDTVGIRDGGGSVLQIRSIVSNITERKQMELELERRVRERTDELVRANTRLREEVQHRIETEKQLRQEHSLRRTIEETIPSGLVLTDLEGRLIYVNPAFCRMAGWEAEELLDSLPPYPYWPQEEADTRTRALLYNLRNNIRTSGIEQLFVRKDGSRFWGLMFGTELQDNDGTIIGRLNSVIDITRRKKTQEDLQQSRKRLRRLSVKLIEAQEAERKRIAQELHDSIGAGLAAVKFSLEKKLKEMTDGKLAKTTRLEYIIPLLQKVIVEAQRISRNLHPSILDVLGLRPAITSFCREYQTVYCSIQVQHDLEMEEEHIPPELHILLYRLVQESLNNIAKHSGADRVEIALRCVTDQIQLTIRDNGKGFDPDALRKQNADRRGLGLDGMKERTELSGGRFEIDSRIGEGTLIQATWPCGLCEGSGI